MSLVVRDTKVPSTLRAPEPSAPAVFDFQGVSLQFKAKKKTTWILRNQSFTVPKGSRLGVLGDTGVGKSVLIAMMAGFELPDRGRISRVGQISWPVGSLRCMNLRLSARENTRFVARLYGLDEQEFIASVRKFSEMGPEFNAVLKTIHGSVRNRFAYSVSLLLDFDCYLVDESFETGDEDFSAKCRKMLRKRLEKADMVLVTKSPERIQKFCDRAAILYRGRLNFYDDIEEAIEIYSEQVNPDASTAEND